MPDSAARPRDPAAAPADDVPVADVDGVAVAAVDGVAVPMLGFGTYKLTGDACVEAVADALALGYRHVDTAAMYGNEAEVGAGLRRSGVPRADVFVTTKVWHTDLAPADVRRSAEASLRALGTDHVDLLLVHWPTPDVPLADTLGAFERLREEGKTRLIGVSNFPPSLLDEAAALADVRVNQMEAHVWLDPSRLNARMQAHGGLLTAYRPLAGGRLDDDPVVARIASAHGVPAAQVALAWLLGQGIAALPKASSAAHRRSNLAAAALRLTPDEQAALTANARARHRRLVSSPQVPDWEDDA